MLPIYPRVPDMLPIYPRVPDMYPTYPRVPDMYPRGFLCMYLHMYPRGFLLLLQHVCLVHLRNLHLRLEDVREDIAS